MIFNKLFKQEKDIIQLSIDSLKNRKHFLLTYLNQHCFNIYNTHPEYRNLLDNNFTVSLDGFGVYLAVKFLGFKTAQKFNATDLYQKIFQQFSVNQTRLFIIGGNLTDRFIIEKTRMKKLNVCGYQNGYFKHGELDVIIEIIDNSSPEVIIIGMGVPKQEVLAAKISESIENKIILCVGGFLEFYFETKKRAPAVMRNFGFEWLHRLITEPARLWKRYLIGIPVFFFNVIKEYFGQHK